MTSSSPPEEALRAFGVADPVPLPGGQGTSWRAGDLVLKPVGILAEPLEWLESLPETTHVRTARPVRAADGRIVVVGWSATPYLAGNTGRDWDHIAAVGRAFSADLMGVVEPEWIRRRDDPWAVADRIAWGEVALPVGTPPWLGGLADRRRPVGGGSTLIHGDLLGNTLFAAGLPPAVIDLSPYFRPDEYAVAIVVVDAVCFQGAPPVTRDLVRGPWASQLLLRATLFRAVTDLLREASAPIERYTAAIALLDRGDQQHG